MSNLPGAELTIEDGGLGTGLRSTGKSVSVIGTCSAGDINTPFGFVNKGKFIAAFGQGPGVEAGCLDIAKGALVIFCKAETSTPGASSAVTADAGNVGACVVSLTGEPFDTYDAIVTTTRDGTAGDTSPAPAFTYSLDGGQTTSGEIRVPAGRTYEIPNTGLTLNFTAATMETDDFYTFTTVEPLWAADGVEAAIDALSASTKEWRFLHLVGTSDATQAAAVATKMDEMEASFRYVSALCEVRDLDGDDEDTWVTAITDDFAAFASRRIAVSAGHCRLKSAVSSRIYRRPFAWAVAQRAVAVEVHVDLGRVKDGPITAVTELFYDERVSEALDGERFITARTFVDEPGFFVTNPNLMSPPGSDFKYWQNRFVMDIACRTTHRTLQREVNDSVRIDDGLQDPTKAGFILEEDAQAIERANNDALRNDLVAPGHCSAARTTVSRDDDILATSTVNAEVEIIPVGYKKKIKASMRFVKSFAA